MIVNDSGTHGVSNLGWVDKGSLWSYEFGAPEPRLVHLSEAKWLSLVPGTGEYFAAVHHAEDGRVRLTAHSHRNIDEIISCIEVHVGDIASNDLSTVLVPRFVGERLVWASLPKAYIVQPLEEPLLLLLDSTQNVARLQSLPWYKQSYDTLYQGILDATEVPGSSHVIISVQRDSEPILYDPASSKVVRKLKLAERFGNPKLFLRHRAPELWASDYDTLVKLDSGTWNVLNVLKLQEGKEGMARLNIGEYCFSPDESMCAVCRPHSGDVLGIDSDEFQVTHQAKLGAHPLDVGFFRDNHVIARDWKTGQPLLGVLHRV